MKNNKWGNSQGAILVLFALVLIVLLGFTALGTEVGKWYLVRSELSKAVDAAALAGAKNISNPYVNPAVLAEEVGYANFSPGMIGTPGGGDPGSVSFSASMVGNDRIQVAGQVSIGAVLARMFGVEQIASSGAGVAQKKEVEIMLVLDRSGSMDGTPIRDLRTAALSFVSYFEDTQDKDKMGLISFATGVTVNHALSNNFVTSIRSAISAMRATGATNAEDALDQADGPSGFTDQSGIPGDRRVQQFVIFFSDGNPTAFRGQFRYNATDFEAVAMGTGQNCSSVHTQLGNTNNENFLPCSSSNPTASSRCPTPTGDGQRISGTPLTTCTYGGSRYYNMRWYVFSDPVYGISNPTNCRRTSSSLQFLAPYICSTARAMAVAHARELKDDGVKIYTIGLGSVDRNFLGQIASGSSFEYYTPNSSQLQALFQAVAREIKLRLVQ